MRDAEADRSDAEDGRRALAAIFDAHHDSVYRFALARCGSRDLAEDITSDTFVHVARMCAAGRASEVTEPWIMVVARRRLIDRWRTEERHRRRLERLMELRPTTPGGTPFDRTSVRDTDVLRALESLSERQRFALTLRYLDELAVAEVADALGSTYAATESLLARARRAFATAYEAGEPR